MKRSSNKAFTILELLVVVAIIAIIAVIAVPNFIGRIDEARDSQELAEINAVGKAISTYYADNGFYPTLQGKDGSLAQVQPIEGAPHNIDFSSLVPDYLATLPHFSYWWVDYQGKIYHTQQVIGAVASSVFTPTVGYNYTLYKTNGTTQVLSASYTLQAGEYILGLDDSGVALPKINSSFKNTKAHPESGEVIEVVELVTFTTATFTNASATGKLGPTQAQLDTAYASGVLSGKVTSLNGIQTWVVPFTGKYSIEALGAAGGQGGGSNGGFGARLKGEFTLAKGDTLFILVGQRGINSTTGSNYGGSGGGGTFVAKGTTLANTVPLVVAGGGAGATKNARTTYGLTAQGSLKCDATITNDANDGYDAATKGTAGYGGLRSRAGGGFYASGESISYLDDTTAFGYGFRQGGTGGTGNSYMPLAGGFGGGAAGNNSVSVAGGGGGYSGGGGSNNGGTSGGIRGGGGSYNSGTNQVNTAGAGTSNGTVVITYVGP